MSLLDIHIPGEHCPEIKWVMRQFTSSRRVHLPDDLPEVPVEVTLSVPVGHEELFKQPIRLVEDQPHLDRVMYYDRIQYLYTSASSIWGNIVVVECRAVRVETIAYVRLRKLNLLLS
jgi:hypothetical protein